MRLAIGVVLMVAGCAAPGPTAFDAPFARASFTAERIARIAEREWYAFGSAEVADSERVTAGGRIETDDGWWQRVGDYWHQGVGSPSTGLHEAADGRPFWSAAFISYVVRAAGAGPRFFYSDVHADYINRAIDQPGALVGYPIDQQVPQRGDILCQARADAVGRVTFARRPQRYPAHCDIVIAASDHAVWVIGGNVADTVARRRFRLVEGRVDPAGAPWLALLRFQR